jgi:hypothetical protein
MELQVFAFLILLMIFAGLIAWRGEAQPYQAIPEQKDQSTTEQLGVPVNFKGCAGSMLSTNLELLPLGQRRKGWFNVNASDYLYRGGEERGLEARLRCYLRGEVCQYHDRVSDLQ